MCKKDFLIKKWMISQLGLSGNELVAYAFLYDATKGGKEVYTGGYRVLTEMLNSTIPTAYNVLKRMRDRKLIETVEGDTLTIKVCEVAQS